MPADDLATVAIDPGRCRGEAAGRPFAFLPSAAAGGRGRIGRYEILASIGVGGCGHVYRGYDPVRGQPVAIKVSNRRDSETCRRFVREAEIGRCLSHRNIAAVLDSGIDRSTPYLVAEYLPGEDLSELIDRRQPETLAEKLEILIQIARGLGHAHSLGVIHRDVKPSNIRVLQNGLPTSRQVKILDFGSAKSDGSSDLTETGMVVGTVAYLAPECLTGDPPTARSDVFSFGVVAFELLSFRRPWNGHNLPSLIDGLLHAAPPPLREDECPAGLADIVLCCLNRDPARRWGSLPALAAALERTETGNA